MVVLHMIDLLTETEGAGDLQLHLRPVLRVTATALGLPEGGHGKGILPYQLLHILTDTAFVAENFFLELFAHLIAEFEGDTLVHHRLPAQHIPIVLHGNVDVGKHLLVRTPVEAGAGLSAPIRGFLLQTTLISALFKVQIVAETIPADGGIKKFGSVLGGAGAQTVEAQAVLIVLAVFAVLAAGVHLAEHQFPVVALFLFVVVHGAAAAEVLHLHGEVFIPGDDDGVAMTLTRLVDGVAEDLKYRVLAAFQIVGAENNGRALAHPILAFQHGDTGVTVLFLFLYSHK